MSSLAYGSPSGMPTTTAKPANGPIDPSAHSLARRGITLLRKACARRPISRLAATRSYRDGDERA